MNIQQEIIEYLNLKNFVILPGLGTLTAEFSEPYLDDNNNIVPSEKVVKLLDYLEDSSDIKLLSYLKDKTGLSQSKIQNEYFSFLDKFNYSLQNYGDFYWAGLGLFSKNAEDGRLNFLFFKESPNKEDIPATPKKGLQVVEEKQEIVISPPAQLPLEEAVIDEEIPGKKNNFLKIILYLLPVILLFGAFIYTVFFKPNTEKAVSIENQIQDQPKEEIKSEQPGVVPDESKKDRTGPETTVKSEHIVRVGYYRDSEDADYIATYLAENGYPSRVRPYGRLFKVFLVAKSESQAMQYIDEVKLLVKEVPVYENKELQK